MFPPRGGSSLSSINRDWRKATSNFRFISREHRLSVKGLLAYDQEANRHRWVRRHLAVLPADVKFLDAVAARRSIVTPARS
jgi:hypothetical protein